MRVSQTDTGTQIAAQGLSDGAWNGTFNFTITQQTTEQIRYSFWNADRYARKTPLLQENGVSRHIFAEKSNTTQYIK